MRGVDHGGWQDEFFGRCELVDGAVVGEGAFSAGPAVRVAERSHISMRMARSMFV